MSVIVHFNTLQYVEKLRAAGISEEHAKAKAEALLAVLVESSSETLATIDDSDTLKLESAEIRSDIKLLKWMMVTSIAMGLSLLVRTFLA